jgi:hypothetical protein
VLLYIRDALGLGVEASALVPPLAGEVLVPDRKDLVGPDARQQAADSWVAWWSRAVAAQGRTELGPHGMARDEWHRRIADLHRQVADPPEWSSLSRCAALQRAVGALYEEGARWIGAARPPFLPPARRDIFEWALVRDVAEATAAAHEVSKGALNGCALVLLVEGSWWELVSPGVALCSVAAATDPAQAATVVRQIFASALVA